jgi:hypothetical protein
MPILRTENAFREGLYWQYTTMPLVPTSRHSMTDTRGPASRLLNTGEFGGPECDHPYSFHMMHFESPTGPGTWPQRGPPDGGGHRTGRASPRRHHLPGEITRPFHWVGAAGSFGIRLVDAPVSEADNPRRASPTPSCSSLSSASRTVITRRKDLAGCPARAFGAPWHRL